MHTIARGTTGSPRSRPSANTGSAARSSISNASILKLSSSWRKRQHDALGALFEREIVPYQKRAQHFAFGGMLDVLQEAVLPRDELAIPNAEDDPGCIVTIAGETDRVGVTTSHDLHRLRLLELIQPFERIPQLRRTLVVLHVARLVHALAQPGAYIERLPRKKQEHIIDHAPVILDALIANARRFAALDMKVETGPVRRLFRQIPGAGPYREDPADDLQRLAQRRDVGVGTKVAGARNRDAPDDEHARKRLRQGHGDLRIALIVAQPDVELRLVFLDERVLEQQRLCLVRNDDRLEVGDLPLQHLPLRTALLVGEVVRDARAEIGRLPDVHNLPGGVFPDVDAGASGKCR